MKIYKVVLLGPTASGKTKAAKELLFGVKDNNYTYKPTLGVEVHPLDVYIGAPLNEWVRFNLWDTGGRYKGLGDGYYKAANFFVILGFPGTSGEEKERWISECAGAPHIYIEDPDELYNALISMI